MTTSIIDQPAFKNATEDQLNMRAYSDALVEFINGAQMPLTIALQGEWGSGKTSLMNALKHDLVDGENGKFLGVWINTWQYSLMMDSNLAIAQILQGMVNQITESSPCDLKTKVSILKRIGDFARPVAIATTNVVCKTVGIGENVGSELDKRISEAGHDGLDDNAYLQLGNRVESLKKELRGIIDKSISETHKRGFVFFIDDLDRIDPPVAVQILELLKNVFDLDKCIFVLAIDYGVVVKGLKSKFGEMTVANEREFRSFFDKIIQLPFAMPVGAYCIDDFLMDSLQKIGYITDSQRKDEKLSKALSDYAHESVGTNPRSLKRLINSLSLMRLLVLRTVPKQDDFDFEDWKEIVFALECIKIQYPQVHSALERFCGFSTWGTAFAQAMGLKALSKDESEKLKNSQGENFDEEWEQMLYALCKNDPFLESRALNISLMLNQIKAHIEGRKENVEDIVTILLKLSAVTSVKSEPVVPAGEVVFNMSDALKTLRGVTLGMKWRQSEKKEPYYAAALADSFSVISWQRRVQSNLACDFVHTIDDKNPYKSDFCLSATLRIDRMGDGFCIRMWGEFWGWSAAGKRPYMDLSRPDLQSTLADVEKGFADGWSSFGIKGNIGHHEKNLWFNVKIPIGSLDLLKDAAFSARLKDALGRTVCPFAKLKPFCTAG